MSCVTVATAAKAVALLTGGTSFDVAVLDARLAGPDGVDLAASLKPLRATASLPLVLLASLGAAFPAATSAFAAVITKPVKATVLRETLEAVLSPHRSTARPSVEPGAEPMRAGGTGDVRRQRILLVEDNLINQKVAQLMLKKIDHHVDTVSNGREAVDAVQALPYDIVLMDVQMPVMDGLEATRQIRRGSPPGGQPYIIAMTASALLEDRAECLAAGMDSHLPKPVREAELRAALQARRAPAASARS